MVSGEIPERVNCIPIETPTAAIPLSTQSVMNHQTITDLTRLAGAFEVVANRFPVSSKPPNSYGFFNKAAEKALAIADWCQFPTADLTRHLELKDSVETLSTICEVLSNDDSLTPHGRQFWSEKVDELSALAAWHDNEISRLQHFEPTAA